MGYFRKLEDHKRITRLYRNTKDKWKAGVYYDPSLGRYIRYYRPKVIRELARASNKAIRHYKDIPNGRKYRYVKVDGRYEAF